MSLILDALNRADRERDTGHQAPNLQVQHEELYNTNPSKLTSLLAGPWMWIGIAVVLAAIAWVIYSIAFQAAPPTDELSTITAPAPPDTTSNNITPIKQQHTNTEHLAKPPPQPGADAEEQEISNDNAQENVAQRDVVQGRKAQQQQSVIDSLYQQASAQPSVAKQPVAGAAKQDESAEVNNIDLAALAAQMERDRHLAKLPYVFELSPQLKREIPNIDYSLHAYAQEEKTGFAVLNGKRIKPGEQIASGLIMVDITEDVAVLDFRGTQFKLGALNSWVNFE